MRDLPARLNIRSFFVDAVPSLIFRSLFEAATFTVNSAKPYFMILTSLLNILKPDDAALAEHIISIISGAYTIWGGLCDVLGRAAQLATTLYNLASDKAWVNAANNCNAQGILQKNADEHKEDCEALQFMDKYKVPGSELEDFELSKAAAISARESLDKTLDDAEEVSKFSGIPL